MSRRISWRNDFKPSVFALTLLSKEHRADIIDEGEGIPQRLLSDPATRLSLQQPLLKKSGDLREERPSYVFRHYVDYENNRRQAQFYSYILYAVFVDAKASQVDTSDVQVTSGVTKADFRRPDVSQAYRPRRDRT